MPEGPGRLRVLQRVVRVSYLYHKLPKFDSVTELVDFFDKTDLGIYNLPDAHFDVNIRKRTFLVEVDRELMNKLAKAARARKTSTSNLVNSWLEEKVIQVA